MCLCVLVDPLLGQSSLLLKKLHNAYMFLLGVIVQKDLKVKFVMNWNIAPSTSALKAQFAKIW